MQFCTAHKCIRGVQLHRGVQRRQPWLLRPIISAGSGSTPESSPDTNEMVTAGQEKQPASGVVPTTAAESNPLVEAESVSVNKQVNEDFQPGPSSTDDDQERVAAVDASSSSSKTLTVHPPDGVEEEEDLIASKELIAEVLDGSSFGNRGEQWVVVQIAAVGMLLFPPLTLKGLVDFGATLALTTGLVFIVTSLFNLGRNISPLPEPRKKHQLIVSGIYGYVRHPMYGGLLLAGFGLAILTRNETRLAILILLWWVLENKVIAEERALSARYSEYTEYKAKVKKFFPFFY